MCLKYFVRYTTCEHHEYLGSCHCSYTPCPLDTQQFHYLYDDFPIPSSSKSPVSDYVSEAGALACNTCTTQQSVQLGPDEVPVRYYAPTNNMHMEAVRIVRLALPTQVISIEPTDDDDDDGDCDYDYDYDYDYKSLSAADDEEWGVMGEQVHDVVDTSMGCDAQEQRTYVQEQMARQLSSLSNHLAQQHQRSSFVPPGLSPDAYAIGSYANYPMPHMMHLARPMGLPALKWRGDVTSLSTAHTAAPLPRPSDPFPPPMRLPTVGNAARPATSATPTTLARCPTEPRVPSTPSFMVGSLTDAYLRIEAGKRRHMRERAERAVFLRLQHTLPAKRESLLFMRESLPARSMSLADCMVAKREKKSSQKVQYSKVHMGEVSGRLG